MSLKAIGQISSVVAAVIAFFGFPLILLQLREASKQRHDAIKLSGSQVLLAVDAVLAAYQDINRNLRPNGDWHGSTEHPTRDEMPLVEPYLGIFERLWIAYSIGQIDIATIDHLYRYGMRNLGESKNCQRELQNKTKLNNKRIQEYWSMFVALTCSLELEDGRPLTGHADNWQPSEWLERKRKKHER